MFLNEFEFINDITELSAHFMRLATRASITVCSEKTFSIKHLFRSPS